MTRSEPGLERVHEHLAAMGAGALSRFKSPYFDRRLKSRLRIRGVADAAAYADILDRDADERRRLLSALAIGVTGFFRNPAAWLRLDRLARAEWGGTAVRAWSAGCATGEEAWSLAMILEQCRAEGVLTDWMVDATDLDERSLEVAAGGEYGDRAVADIEAALGRVPGTAEPGRYLVPDGIRTRTRFTRADLTAAPPATGYDLVVCRNVLIYFDTEAQQSVMRSLLESIRLGGFLMLGKAELAAFELLPRLEIVDRLERIYRRVA